MNNFDITHPLHPANPISPTNPNSIIYHQEDDTSNVFNQNQQEQIGAIASLVYVVGIFIVAFIMIKLFLSKY